MSSTQDRRFRRDMKCTPSTTVGGPAYFDCCLAPFAAGIADQRRVRMYAAMIKRLIDPDSDLLAAAQKELRTSRFDLLIAILANAHDVTMLQHALDGRRRGVSPVIH